VGDIVDFEASIYAGSSAFILIHVFSPLLLLLMCVYIARVILSSCNPSLFSPSRIYMGHWACTQRDWESYKRKYCAVILKKECI
jgi:hypothetical protein